MLRDLHEKHRLPKDERREANRQVRNLHTHNWMKKHSLKAVARTDLSKKRRMLLRGCFQLLDGDGSGTVEPAELGLAMTNLGFTSNDVRMAFEMCDRNGDGKLDFDDFVQLFTVAWAHREKRIAFQDSFARDMSEVVAQACRPVVPDGPGVAVAAESDEQEHVTTSFPFVLVANSHRISKLVDECDPIVRERHLPALSRSIPPPSTGRRGSVRSQLPPHLRVRSDPAPLPPPSERAEALAFTSIPKLPSLVD